MIGRESQPFSSTKLGSDKFDATYFYPLYVDCVTEFLQHSPAQQGEEPSGITASVAVGAVPTVFIALVNLIAKEPTQVLPPRTNPIATGEHHFQNHLDQR